MIAHNFYLRKKETEHIFYPEPIEDALSFHDCHQYQTDITHVKIMKVEILESEKKYNQSKIC